MYILLALYLMMDLCWYLAGWSTVPDDGLLLVLGWVDVGTWRGGALYLMMDLCWYLAGCSTVPDDGLVLVLGRVQHCT